MRTTREVIKGWLERAKEQKATHLIVVCDTFDHEDYPVFVLPDQDARVRYEEYNGKNMQRVMEVYNLSKPLDEQLARFRCFEF